MREQYAKIYLKKGKEAPVLRHHPWIFSGAIAHKEGNPQAGDVVEIYSHKRDFLAIGHFQQDSISVKIISFSPTAADQDFWDKKIKKAFALRQNLNLTNNNSTNAYRLVNTEGDGLPGLIIDIYNGTAVFQAHSAGMYNSRDYIVNALQNIYGATLKAVYSKSADTLPAEIQAPDEYLFGKSEEQVVKENDILFKVDWEGGQKTGFFLDQRENRKLLQEYVQGKKVLNAYSYSGGFSLYALKAGAVAVDSIDRSKGAIDLLEENILLNQFQNKPHQSLTGDVQQYLREQNEKYDVVILDPPAFAKHQDARHRAVKGYKNINALAMQQINAGGIIFTFSCSQVVDRNLFQGAIMAAAIESGRNVRILEQLGQAPDHPVSAFHPEGGYLKGLVLYVE